MLYVGVDPGGSGAVSILGGPRPASYPFRGALETAADYLGFLGGIPEFSSPEEVGGVVLERVGGFVAGNPTPGSAMFAFGRGFGILEALLLVRFGPTKVRLINPPTWQTGLGIEKRRRDESAAEWKRRLKWEASQLFPHEKVTLATADSLLLAEYCRRSILWGEMPCRQKRNRSRR